MSGGSLPSGMAPAVGGGSTAAELGTTAAGAGLPNLPQQSALQAGLSGLAAMGKNPQALQGLMAQHPQQGAPMVHPAHPMGGAPVQMQGLLGAPQTQAAGITVPMVNQILARGLMA